MSNLPAAEYLGARATPGLVDRTSILDQIKAAIDDRDNSYVIYITAEGGMGKTFLLGEVLRRLQEGGEWYRPDGGVLAAGGVVDLYHPQNHSIEGLTYTIWKLLEPAQAAMADYQAKLARFEREKYHRRGREALPISRNEVAETFLADLNLLTKDRRLVLALDTTEKLLYEMDKVQEILGLETDIAGITVRSWLLQEFLPKLSNAVILMAGRPRPQRLRADLHKTLGARLIEYELSGFETQDDVVAYFDAVAQAARERGNKAIADQITAIPDDMREVIWLYTKGRPILLSLMIDYLMMANELLPLIKVPVKEARAKSRAELDKIEAEIEAELVRHFQNTGRSADEAIRALAWARKGMDAAMLADIVDMSMAEARERLAELRGLSFVKVRPGDDRVFLHDEMYEMLHRHVLARLPRARHQKVYSTIVTYYDHKLIPTLQKRLADLESEWRQRNSENTLLDAQALEETLPELASLTSARYEVEHAIVEKVYYRLRQNSVEGFKDYFESAEEAVHASDISRDMLLRDELLEFMGDPKYQELWQTSGLSRSVVEWDAGIRWIKRFIFYRGNYAEALRIAEELRTQFEELMGEAGPLAEPELNIWEGWPLTLQGLQLDTAETHLRSAINTLQAFRRVDDAFTNTRRNTLMAQAYNILGFLYRTRGQYQRAIKAYQQALPLWRKIRFEADHANTLNNLALAYGEADEFSQAIRLARNAVELRRRLGPAAPVGLSLNTLGIILIRADQPAPACVACEHALVIFRQLEHTRGIGLAATALAEALRRLNSTLPELYSVQNRAEMLRRATNLAQEAVTIFSTERRQEKARYVEALIVLGSIQRDWIPLRSQYESDADPQEDQLAGEATRALRQASDEAPPGLLYRRVEALVNLAWMYSYIGQLDQARAVTKEATDLIPEEYFIKPESGLPRPGLPVPFLWVQLAKSHTLLGHLTLRDFRAANEQYKRTGLDADRDRAYRDLRQAARDYTLGMAYDGYFRRDIRNVGRGHDRIYNDLKTLNLEELRIIFEETIYTASRYQLGEQTLMLTFLEQSFGPVHLSWSEMGLSWPFIRSV